MVRSRLIAEESADDDAHRALNDDRADSALTSRSLIVATTVRFDGCTSSGHSRMWERSRLNLRAGPPVSANCEREPREADHLET
jgi:hypothetical protein